MGSPHPVMPALNHMLFAWGLALKDDILAQMIEHTFMMLTAVGLYAWGRRQGRPLFGLAVAAFWLANPLVLWLGESAYVDIALVCFTLLGVYALRRFWETRYPQLRTTNKQIANSSADTGRKAYIPQNHPVGIV